VRIAVAHEWLTNWAGSEQVAKALVDVSGASEVVTAIADPTFARSLFSDVPVRTLWPDRLPDAAQHWKRYAPALLGAWSTTRIEADALLVSSHFAAHGATVRFDGPSIVYYHTPARLFWRPDLELERLPRRLRGVATRALPALQAYDRWVAQHPTVLLANSRAVADRIKEAYGREATVVHPPVDTERWSTVERGEPRHVLWFGRLVGYKQPQLAIEAAREAGLPIVLIGDGPERPKLESLGYEGATFLGHADEATVRAAMSEAICLIHPGEEDFGMTAVEAQAAGVPVVALAAGGALETVRHGTTGLLVDQPARTAFVEALVLTNAQNWDVQALRSHAMSFGPSVFQAKVTGLLKKALVSPWTSRPSRDGSPVEPTLAND
jgi:glycosyltransferase involved in cell wall biosynthesis